MKRVWWTLLAFTIGTNLVTPLFPLYQVRFHMNTAMLSLLFSTYALFLLPSLLAFGSLSDQLGRKRILLLAMYVFTAASAIYAFAVSQILLFLARALQGVATGAFLGTCTANMVDLTPEFKRPRTLLAASFTTMLGFGLGPGLSGFVAQYVSFQTTTTPFLIHILLMVVAIVLVSTVPETVTQLHNLRLGRIRVGVPKSMKRSFWRFIAPAGFIFFALNGTVIALIPLYTSIVLHRSSLSLGGSLVFLLMLVGGFAQLAVRNCSMRSVTKWGLVLTVVGAFIMLVAGPCQSPVVLFLGTLVEGVGNGWTFKGSLALAGNVSDKEVRAQVISTYYIAAYAGFSVPVFATGWLSLYFGLQQALLLLSIIITLLMLWTILGKDTSLYLDQHRVG